MCIICQFAHNKLTDISIINDRLDQDEIPLLHYIILLYYYIIPLYYRFGQYVKTFQNYDCRDLLRLSKSELAQVRSNSSVGAASQ